MKYEFTSYRVRQLILDLSKRAGVGHIGSSLSVADIIVALFRDILHIPTCDNQDRDRFILSKGHAGLALYVGLYLSGYINEAELYTFCRDGSALGVHPDHIVNGIDFSTGSLGHGLSMGVGAALAAQLQKSKRRVFVLLSDAECNEGALWEAVMLSAHHKLSNLIAIIDLNSQQALGYTKDICDLQPMEEKWKAFGWNAIVVNGHDINEIVTTIQSLNTESSNPHVLIAKTTFGKGVSYMENRIKWHYWPMSDDEYKQALNEIKGSS